MVGKPGTLFGREPALIIGLVAAVLNLAVGLGLNLTGDQVALINAFATAAAAVLTRQAVYAPDTVARVGGQAQEELRKAA